MVLKTALELNLLRNSYRPETQTLPSFSVVAMASPSDTGFPDLKLLKYRGAIFILHADHVSNKVFFRHIHRPSAQKHRLFTQ